MTSYHHLALYYDQAMNHVDFEQWSNFLLYMINKEQINPEKIVDLGCGTGEITMQLAEKGFRMTGIDISADMLTVASQKSNEKNLEITWLQQDIRELAGFSNEKLFISFFDVMNYIRAEKDLINTFQHVFNSLETAGYFIFDVHHIEHVTRRLVGNSFSHLADDYAYIWNCIAGDKKGHMVHDINFFVKESGQYYKRFTELHEQKTLEIADYKKILKNIGFSKIEFYSDFNVEKSFFDENSERIFFIAKK